MGGINHQPTKNRLTAASALLSQQFCQGFTCILKANDSLENALITSMDKLYVEDATSQLQGTPSEFMRDAIVALEQSLDAVENTLAAYSRIMVAAKKEEYTGNSLAGQVRSMGFVSSFEQNIIKPYIQRPLWESIEKRVCEENTFGVLEWEKGEVEKVIPLTRMLIDVMKQCLTVAERNDNQAFTNAIEMNELPLRQQFAQVFSYWGYLQTMFLYAAMIMTELFYRENGYPSLLKDSSGEETI